MAEKLRIAESALSPRKLATAPASAILLDNNDADETELADVPNRTKTELEAVYADEISELKEAAYDESFSKGYEEGRQAAEDDFKIQKDKWQEQIEKKELELDNTITALVGVLDSFQQSVDGALQNIKPAAVTIAFAGLTRLLGESEQYRERLAQQVHHALEQFGHETPTRIFINPEDAKILKGIERLDSWSEMFVQDASFKPGSCIIEAGPRSLEASLVEQVSILSRTLLKLSQT
jgi:flagellar biosynthesis/type III secretory pathway protein FliH